MKTKTLAVSGSLTLALSMSLPVMADSHETPNLDPVELYACTFREGKTLADLDELDARYKTWADENNKDQSSWRMVPMLRDLDAPFHVGYIGSWNTGGAMGAGMGAWMGNSELLAEYQETIDCGHSLFASAEINAPKGPPKDGVVWFATCKVQDNASDALAIEAHKRMAGAMREMGNKGQSWLFYPSLGFGIRTQNLGIKETTFYDKFA